MITKQYSFTCVIIPVLLGVWMDVSSGQSVQLIPQYPVIQGSVTLRITGVTGILISVTWYKAPTPDLKKQISYYIYFSRPVLVKGPLFHDRMTVTPDGSLMISNLDKADEGNYTVKIKTDKEDDVTVYLQIYEIIGKPTITASSTLPKENDTVTLTCNSSNVERIVWSRVPSGATLSSDNRTITFSRIMRTDSGDYQCEGINPSSANTSDPFTLTVAYGPENVKIVGQSLNYSTILLTCYADSVPPPSYQWSNGIFVSAQQNELHVDLANSDNKWMYTCAVSNPVTRHTATASSYIHANNALVDCQAMDPPRNGLGAGEIAAIVIGSIFGILILEVMVYFVLRRRRKTPSSPVFVNTHAPEQNTYELTLPGAQEKTSQESNYEQLGNKDLSIYSIIEPGKY